MYTTAMFLYYSVASDIMRDGTPKLVILAPFPSVLVMRCTYYVVFLPSRETLVYFFSNLAQFLVNKSLPG